MKLKVFKNNFYLCLLTFIFCIACFGGIIVFSVNAQSIDTNQPYFYSLLNNDNAKKFYQAIAKMDEDGLLLEGNSELNLVDSNFITEKQIANYQRGSVDALKDYGAGRDAYIMDNADNFYTDFTKLSISFGTQNGKYLATLGTGRTDNYYIEGGFNSKDQINQAKQQLSQRVATLVGDFSSLTDYQKIERANNILIDNVAYSFCNEQENLNKAPFIRTAYGSLVNGLAVCEGYARGVKVLLDYMGVENQLVNGYLLSNEGAYESHMWNYVKLDNKWYALDSTINDTMGQEKYCFLQGEEDFSYEHLEEKVISQSGYSFDYPLLSTYNYGQEKLPTKVTYTGTENEKTLLVELNYNNLSATNLAKTGLYLAVNYSSQTSTQDEIDWTGYASISELIKIQENVFVETDTTTTFRDWGSIPYVKFAVINKAPDVNFGRYTSVADSEILCESDVITNYAFKEGDVASPFAYSVSPSNTAKMDINKKYHIELKYDEKLVKSDENDVSIEVVSTHGATSEQYSLTNIVWNEENNQLSFDFAPSKMFLHNGDGYNFAPVNLVGENSGKRPYAVSYSFQYKSIVCNKILDSGALYMDVVAHPTLIDNSDLSMQNWKLNGEQVGENQRSQLALVVTTPSENDQNDMHESILDKENLQEKDVLSSSTYELDLDLCGFLTRVPNGTYMKVAFGFPQGYSAKDAGITFKLYHFKRGADGKIDPTQTVEIPCVITEYGLVAEINDFSPFAVVAVAKDKIVSANKKSVYSRVIGNGGSIKLENSNQNLAFVEQNGKVTYVVTADEGYKVDYVLINQEKLEVVDGKIELAYEKLQDSNILEVSFVANRVVEYERQNGITNLQQSFSTSYNIPNSNTRVILIAVLSIVVGILVIGTALLIVIVKKKKSKNN